MKIKTTFEFSDGTTITLTKEQVEELRAALAPAPVYGEKLPPSIFDQIKRQNERFRWLEETAARNPFVDTLCGPKILCEATQ